jgi:hypothetical protein
MKRSRGSAAGDRSEARSGRGGTQDAIRKIVRRYRETFERLGR